MLNYCLTPAVKHGGGNVMVWVCFGADEVGDFYRVKRILIKESCHSYLASDGTSYNRTMTQRKAPNCKNYLWKKQPAAILSIME